MQHYLQYYFSLDGKPELRNVNELVRSAYGSAAMVFLVLEAERTYVACREVLRILEQAQRIVTEKADSSDNNFWLEVDHTLGRVMREFQNAARAELEVNGPEWPWVEPARETQV